MKLPHKNLRGIVLVAALPLLPLDFSCAQSTHDAPPPARISEADFPYNIHVTTWPASEGFRAGDDLRIESVKGDMPKIAIGGTYLVQGSYTLGSASQATLMLSLTTRGPSGHTPFSPAQRLKIDQGSGTFLLVATMQDSGDYHVSFYFTDPADKRRSSSGGGIYFANR